MCVGNGDRNSGPWVGGRLSCCRGIRSLQNRAYKKLAHSLELQEKPGTIERTDVMEGQTASDDVSKVARELA